MLSERKPSTIHHIMMDDENLGLKPDFFIILYKNILSDAMSSAPSSIRNEIEVLQDGKTRTKFKIIVSSKMAPYLISAIQRQISREKGVSLRSYLCKLQEQLMSEMFR
jgi:hypothetical protein